jgi:DNA/RNA-binding domain of Phe-tRNA-synthetase-like protein
MIKVLRGFYSILAEKGVLEGYPGVKAMAVEVKVRPKESYDLETALKKVGPNVNYELESLKDDKIVRAYRDFYWRMGIDPTKQRPASEALVRRFLSKGTLPKISYIVDAGNLASIETLIPIGIYDLRYITGEPRLRLAEKGERFVDVVQKEKLLEGKEIVLADEEGPLHLFPYRDSYRTRVREDTEDVMVVSCGVEGIDDQNLRNALERVLYWLNYL